jgi:hypothetical protein
MKKAARAAAQDGLWTELLLGLPQTRKGGVERISAGATCFNPDWPHGPRDNE